jgi:eukaryotic-like serine/threonine-protein kinase
VSGERYSIGSQIGEGATSIVYRGDDNVLKRQVAIKVVKQDATSTTVRRFEQEGEYLAQLEHENVVRVYDFCPVNGRSAIVMELVGGPSLEALIRAKRIRRLRRSGRLTVRRAAHFGAQIANAVDAAHQKDLLHRDIKPGNIAVTATDCVKVLDFGLAKRVRAKDFAATLSMDKVLTEPGVVVGTLPYIAPERLKGLPAQPASDQYSVAVVIYEMLTGRRPFVGADAQALIAAILGQEPEWPRWLIQQWPDLVRVVTRGLEKDPANRYPSVTVFRAALENSVKQPEGKMSWHVPYFLPGTMVTASVAALGLLMAIAYLHLQPGEKVEPQKIVAGHPENSDVITQKRVLKLDAETMLDSPSPLRGGASIVLANQIEGHWHIGRQVDSTGGMIDLTPGAQCDNTQPDVSADGMLLIYSSTCGRGGLFTIDSNGGKPEQVRPDGRYPAWSPKGTEFTYSLPSGLWRYRLGTSSPVLLHSGAVFQSAWSPSGKWIAFAGFEGLQHNIFLVPRNGGPVVQVTNDLAINVQPHWAQSGDRLYFLSNRTGRRSVWSVPVSSETGEVTGQAQEELRESYDIAAFAISPEGQLICVEQQGSSTIEKINLTLDQHNVSVDGKPTSLVSAPDISPSGADLTVDPELGIYTSEPTKNIVALSSPTGSKLTLVNDGRQNRRPRRSPDGKWIAYDSSNGGAAQIYLIKSSGGTPIQLTRAEGAGANGPVWSPDGKRIAFARFAQPGQIMEAWKPWGAQKPITFPPLRREPGCVFVARSWRGDGREIAGYSLCPGGMQGGILLFDVSRHTYRQLSDFGIAPAFIGQGQFVVFANKSRFYWVEANSPSVPHELFALDDGVLGGDFAASSDGREIYYTRFKPHTFVYAISSPLLGMHVDVKLVLPH